MKEYFEKYNCILNTEEKRKSITQETKVYSSHLLLVKIDYVRKVREDKFLEVGALRHINHTKKKKIKEIETRYIEVYPLFFVQIAVGGEDKDFRDMFDL